MSQRSVRETCDPDGVKILEEKLLVEEITEKEKAATEIRGRSSNRGETNAEQAKNRGGWEEGHGEGGPDQTEAEVDSIQLHFVQG